MGHSRKNKVRAFAINRKRLDLVGFPEYNKLESKQLTEAVKNKLGIKSIAELCWVCVSCSSRNGCTSICGLRVATTPTAFTTPTTATTTPSSSSGVPSNQPPLSSGVNVPLEETEVKGPDSEAKLVSDYIMLYFKEHIQPTLIGKSGQVSPQVLRERKILSDSFVLPNPRQVPHLLVGKVCILNIDVAWVCAGMVVKVVDFELFEPACPGFYCKCQLDLLKAKSKVKSALKKMQRNGVTSHVRSERGFGGLMRYFVLVDYVCRECTLAGGSKTSSYNTFSPLIIDQLPPQIRASLDFVVHEKFVLHRSSQTLVIAAMEQGGLGFGNLADISARVCSMDLAHREKERQLEAKSRALCIVRDAWGSRWRDPKPGVCAAQANC
jgi:hypothetical protein